MKGKIRKILVVDDEKEIAVTLSNLLRDEGFEVATAFNPWQALDVVVNFQPDLCFIDSIMPISNGPELARQLHSFPALKNIPIYLMSLNFFRGPKEDVRGILQKPIYLKDVLRIIQEAS